MKYETKILFLRLFYPTLLVVITVVQLQMFHKKYLEQVELPSLTSRRDSTSTSGIQPSSSVNYGNLEPETPSEEGQKAKSHYTRINVSDLKNLTTKQVNRENSIEELSFMFNKLYHFHSFTGSQTGSSILQSYKMVLRYILAVYGITFHQSDFVIGIYARYQ